MYEGAAVWQFNWSWNKFHQKTNFLTNLLSCCEFVAQGRIGLRFLPNYFLLLTLWLSGDWKMVGGNQRRRAWVLSTDASRVAPGNQLDLKTIKTGSLKMSPVKNKIHWSLVKITYIRLIKQFPILWKLDFFHYTLKVKPEMTLIVTLISVVLHVFISKLPKTTDSNLIKAARSLR